MPSRAGGLDVAHLVADRDRLRRRGACTAHDIPEFRRLAEQRSAAGKVRKLRRSRRAAFEHSVLIVGADQCEHDPAPDRERNIRGPAGEQRNEPELLALECARIGRDRGKLPKRDLEAPQDFARAGAAQRLDVVVRDRLDPIRARRRSPRGEARELSASVPSRSKMTSEGMRETSRCRASLRNLKSIVRILNGVWSGPVSVGSFVVLGLAACGSNVRGARSVAARGRNCVSQNRTGEGGSDAGALRADYRSGRLAARIIPQGRGDRRRFGAGCGRAASARLHSRPASAARHPPPDAPSDTPCASAVSAIPRATGVPAHGKQAYPQQQAYPPQQQAYQQQQQYPAQPYPAQQPYQPQRRPTSRRDLRSTDVDLRAGRRTAGARCGRRGARQPEEAQTQSGARAAYGAPDGERARAELIRRRRSNRIRATISSARSTSAVPGAALSAPAEQVPLGREPCAGRNRFGSPCSPRRRSRARSSRRSTPGSRAACSPPRSNGSARRSPRSGRSRPIRAAA